MFKKLFLKVNLGLICIGVLSNPIAGGTKSEKMASSWQRKEAEGTPQKQLPTPTTLMT